MLHQAFGESWSRGGAQPMRASSGAEARHPHFVSIPDARHPLQLTFLEAEGERSWIEEMRGLLSAGRVDEADVRLTAELGGFDGAIARLCKATAAADVTLEGWEDLLPIVAEWEGPPI